VVGLQWFLVAASVLLPLSVLVLSRTVFRKPRRPNFERAKRLFRLQREQLEAKFIDLAQVSPNRGTSRWLDCLFDDEVTYVCNKRTNQLSAFVAITVTLPSSRPFREFEQGYSADAAIQEALGFPTAGTVRLATAIFMFQQDNWMTEGRAIFNMSPAETARFYQHDLKIVGDHTTAMKSSTSKL
jgi:hypothetical protein